MSKGPDLSAFPIPRKGGARPISLDELTTGDAVLQDTKGEGGRPTPAARHYRDTDETAVSRPDKTLKGRPLASPVQQAPSPTVSGQVVATTVKLDESRYLRLVNAGQPGPGRLKRRAIQEMMVEAIDEWFERRGL